jgi:hypothetical protein
VDAGGEGRGGFSGYADTIHKGARAIAAAGDDPKARAAAINAASKELQAYFAAGAKAPAGSKENTLPGLAVARLAGQISEDAAVNAALVRSVLSDGKTPAGKPAVTFDGKANEADVASLKAALASDKPEERAAALKAWIADRSGDKTTGGFHIKGKLSDEQLAAVVAASNGADVDARLAGVFAAANKLAQPTDARLAGASAPAARIAGSGDILAGLLASGAITAKDREQLLALQAAPNEAARLAGVNSWLAGYVANENSKLSYTGLNLVDAAKLVIAAVIPHKPDDPKVPNNPVPGCTNCPFPDRPDIPPVIPSIPNIPNIPNPNAPVIPH